MKKNNFQLSIFNFQLILLLLFAGCNPANTNDNQKTTNQVSIDTVFASKMDSLEYISKTGKPSDQLTALNELMYFYLYRDIAAAKQYAEEGLVIARKEKFKMSEANCINFFGALHSFNNHLDSALTCYNEALKIYEEIDNKRGIAKTQMDMAVVFDKFSEFDEALKYNQYALDYFTSIDDYLAMASVTGNMARIFNAMKDLDKYDEYIDRAMDLYEKASEKQGFAVMLTGKMWSATERGQFKEAIEFGERALSIFRELNSSMYIGYTLSRMAEVYIKMEQFEKAKVSVEESIDVAKQVGNNTQLQESLRIMAEICLKQKQYALASKYTDEAMAIIDTTLNYAVVHAYSVYTLSSIMLGNKEEAYSNFKKFVTAKDKEHNEQWADKLTEMEAKYENEKKQLEIEQQKSIIDKQNLQRGLLLGGVAICVVFLALLWFMLRLRIRRNLALTERNEVLLEMNATKDKFFNIISHDLKNPTLALHDNLKLLVSNVLVWDAETLTDFSNELLKSTEGQVELLNSLLNWARIQTGRITYIPATFDLAARLRSDVSLIRKMAENKNINLICQIPDDATVIGDSNMLVTVVRNLLTNAVKFTESGGKVILSVESVTGKYNVAVSDTGTGMTPEQIENLFRIDKPQTRRGTEGEEGSGLGLIVCKELLGMHGSELHVESKEGKGSRFWFELKNSLF